MVRTGGRGRLRAALFVGIGLGMTGFALIAYGANVFRQLELDTVDTRFAVRGTQEPPPELVVVQIDDVTFDELDQRWPFPRTIHARVVDRLREDGARGIFFDVQFTEPSEREEEDIALIEAVERARGKVALATTETNEDGGSNIFGGEETLRDIGARSGNALLPEDSGGIIRRVAYAVDGLEAFSLVGAEIVTGREIDPSELGGGEDGAWIDYHGPPGTIRAISYSQVSERKTDAGFFRDRIVIVGPSAPSLQDVHPTSTSGDDLMSGAEIQANALSTALRGFPLQSVRQEIDLALIVLLGLIIPLASMRLSLLKVVPLAIGVAALFAVGVQLAFNAGHIVTFLHPFAALVLSTVGALGAYYTIAAFERQRTRDVFSRFVPEAVVDQVLARTDSDLRLGGVRVEGTVMFTDIRGFTTFSETNEAERVIEILNRYLSEMTDAIMENGGTLLSYLGDGILAVFGAPIEQRDHADRALATAREMLGERLSRFNEWAREQGVGDGFRMGVGLHSGPFMAGNVGSERRLEYTAIGDTCNTASRIEGMTKGTPHMLFLAESTRVALLEEPDDLLFVDEFEVRGRQGSVKIWSLADGQAATSALGRETLR